MSGKKHTLRVTVSAAAVALATLVFCAASVSAQVYTYTKSNGRKVFTNVPGKNRKLVHEGWGGARRMGRGSNITERRQWFQETHGDFMRREAVRKGLDERLVRCVIEVESGFNPRAVSPKGAKGLMQLMPGTARRFGVSDAFDPVQNMQGGITYLSQLMDLYDRDIDRVLAAYNAGEKAVEKYNGIPPYRETTNYVKMIKQMLKDQGATIVLSRPVYRYRDNGGKLVYSHKKPSDRSYTVVNK